MNIRLKKKLYQIANKDANVDRVTIKNNTNRSKIKNDKEVRDCLQRQNKRQR